MIELRRPTEEDRSTIRELAALSFNIPVRWMRGEGGPPTELDHYLCAYEGGTLLATSRDIPMSMVMPLRVRTSQ